MPGYVPIALRGDGLQTASTGAESADAYFEERTRTFSNGETITYYVADGMVVEADMILHNDVEAFEAMLDEYERLLQAQEGDAIAPQAIFADPHCATSFLGGCLHYTNAGRQWPNGIVYYDARYIDQNFSPSQRSVVYKAMADITRDTGNVIRFQNRTSGARLIFKNSPGAGCNAELGYTGSSQLVMLANISGKTYGCSDNLGTVIHEIGHALGLLHEQQRCYRDQDIVVNYPNLTSKGQSAFEKRCDHHTTYQTFDYLSVMLYPATTSDASFVYNTRSSMFTIAPGRTLPINPETGVQLVVRDIGRLDFLSPQDVVGLKARYR